MKRLSQSLNLKSDSAVYAAAIAIALVIAVALLVTYYAILTPEPEEYTAIYLLDANKKAIDYPEYFVAGVNSTFSVYVEVENHLGQALANVEVRVKVVEDLNPTFPIDVDVAETLSGAVEDGGTLEKVATVTLNEPGNYGVFFELWIPGADGQMQFSNNFCVLNVRVVV